MGRRILVLAAWAALLAASLAAQDFKAGDLMPRNGIIAYFASDRPDVFYRLLGKDEKGEWRLKSLVRDKKGPGSKDPETDEKSRQAQDFMFGIYDATASLEMGFLDVTLGGGKFLMYLRAKPGQSYNLDAPVIKELFKEEKAIHGVKVRVYNIPLGEKARTAGMDTFYIAQVKSGLILSNFESAITDSLQRLTSVDFSESLSSRPEFKEWRDKRKPRDLSLFIVGREFQAALERMMPGKEQSKRDLQGAYAALDGWLQLREYKSIVIEFDFDDKAGGFDIEVTLTTQRRTRLLDKLAVSPAEFKHINFLPSNVTMAAGFQLGDASTTFDNLVEFLRDAEKASKLAKRDGPRPPDEKDRPRPDESGAEKSIDATLARLDKHLGEMGSSVKEIVSSLGSEIIVFWLDDAVRVGERRPANTNDMLRKGRVGVVVGLSDVKLARGVFERLLEKDRKKEDIETSRHGRESVHFHRRAGVALCLTDDALLIAIAPPTDDKDAAALLDLQTMLDNRGKPSALSSQIQRCSKFITVRVGEIAALTKAGRKAAAEAVSREAKPLTGSEWFDMFDRTLVTLRLAESKDSVTIGLKVSGLPPLGAALGSVTPLGASGGAAEKAAAWSYAQTNARELGRGLRRFLSDNDKTPLSFAEALKSSHIRVANLQSPFDKRWKGSSEKLRYASPSFLVRGDDGEYPPWVDVEAAKIVEDNEKAGFVSFELSKDAADWLRNYREGFIVAYQSSPDAFSGRVVIYGDGEIGWLSEAAFRKAQELNNKGEAVPSENDPKDKPDNQPPRPPRDPDPWGPGGSGK